MTVHRGEQDDLDQDENRAEHAEEDLEDLESRTDADRLVWRIQPETQALYERRTQMLWTETVRARGLPMEPESAAMIKPMDVVEYLIGRGDGSIGKRLPESRWYG